MTVSDANAANKTTMAIQTSLIDTVAALNPNGEGARSGQL